MQPARMAQIRRDAASEVVSVSPRRDFRPTGSWVPFRPFAVSPIRPFAVSPTRPFAICYFLSAILLFPSMARYLTGIQPSGILHIGNYFGALRPAVELQEQGDAFYFIADYHAFTSLQNPDHLRRNVLPVPLDFLDVRF